MWLERYSDAIIQYRNGPKSVTRWLMMMKIVGSWKLYNPRLKLSKQQMAATTAESIKSAPHSFPFPPGTFAELAQ